MTSVFLLKHYIQPSANSLGSIFKMCMESDHLLPGSQLILGQSCHNCPVGLPCRPPNWAPCFYSQPHAQCSILKTQVRSCHSSAQNPPVVSHFFRVRAVRARILTVASKALCTLGFLLAFWSISLLSPLFSQPDPRGTITVSRGCRAHCHLQDFAPFVPSAQMSAFIASLPFSGFFSNITFSARPYLITLNSVCSIFFPTLPIPFSHLIFLHSILPGEKCLFLYVCAFVPLSPKRTEAWWGQELCLLCSLLYHQFLQQCSTCSRFSVFVKSVD